MNRRAFTLIELMIVVAIMGIMAESFFQPIQLLLGIDKKTRAIIDHNQLLATAFIKLKKFSKERPNIDSCSDHMIKFSDGATIILDADSSEIFLCSGEKKITLSGLNFKMPLSKLDHRTWALSLQVNGEDLKTMWRCGK